MKSWTVIIDEEGMLPLPVDLLAEAGWKEGDCIHWIDNYDGTWSLVKEELTTFIKSGKI